MSSLRLDKIRQLIKKEIGQIVRELNDPRLGFITITDVEVSADLRHAKVFFSTLGGSEDKEKSLKGLNSAKGFVRNQLCGRITLRYMPEITFKFDKSIEYSAHITELLEKVKKENS